MFTPLLRANVGGATRVVTAAYDPHGVGCRQSKSMRTIATTTARTVSLSSLSSTRGEPMAVSSSEYPPFPPAVYPVSQKTGTTTDRVTRGSWRGKYGKDGYILFGYDNGSDVKSLPSYVASVSIFKGDTVFVGKDAHNSSYLEAPPSSSSSSSFSDGGAAALETTAKAKPVEVVGSEGGRALGFVTAGGDGSQGTVLDVNVTASSSFYTLALYTVGDVKPPSRATWAASRQAIRVMDLETLNVITPDPLLDVMDGGLYWTMRYNRSVRLRVMPIDSDAGFSAVFFDTE